MLSLTSQYGKIRQSFSDDFTAAGLKTAIVIWAIFVIILTLFVIEDKWVLAGILAYEVLP